MESRKTGEGSGDRTGSFAADGVGRVSAIDGSAAHKFAWGSIQWLCSGELFPDAQQTFGHVQILPGRKNPRHKHPNSDEVLLLLEGELEHSLGDVTYRLTPGMAIHIPLGVEHDAFNTGNTVARMVVSYPTSKRQVVGEEDGEE